MTASVASPPRGLVDRIYEELLDKIVNRVFEAGTMLMERPWPKAWGFRGLLCVRRSIAWRENDCWNGASMGLSLLNR